MYTGQVTFYKVPEKTRPCLTGLPVYAAGCKGFQSKKAYRQCVHSGDKLVVFKRLFGSSDNKVFKIIRRL